MLDKKIIDYLKQKKSVSLGSLYQKFNVQKPREKRNIKELLDQLQKQKILAIHPKTYRITLLSEDFRPLHKDTKPDTRSFKEKRPPIIFGEVSQDFDLIKQRYELPNDFTNPVKQEIDSKIWEQTPQTLEKHRKDLTDLFVVTIDGQDSKDLDDAVSISRSFFGNWELGVHIADVSYYVPQNSELDREAYQRANSYYFVNKVITMLPQALSNELCSLNPNEEKKAVSVFIAFDRNGTIKKYRFELTTIKTNYRMTYDRVEELLKGAKDNDPVLMKNINLMYKLFRILNKKRLKDGSIDFSFKERKIVLDEEDNPTKIYQKDRLDSERLIEEFMLAANQATGDFLTKNKMGLYRVHDIPPAEKYQRLRKFAEKRGYKMPDIPVSKDLQLFVESLNGSPIQMSGEILTLRSMAQAVYQQENIGHFGLGFSLYAHFTSPIRRYADLVVHRLIKYYLFKTDKSPYTKDELDKIGSYISTQERVAMEGERDYYKIKSVRYMKQFEGKTLQGTIGSVTNFGLFVEVQDSGVEAMIRYVDMKNYINFDEDELIAYNKSRSKVYSIGMPMTIRIKKVNTERGFIDAEEINSK